MYTDASGTGTKDANSHILRSPEWNSGIRSLCEMYREIWKSELPNIGGVATLPIWYTAMFLLQMLCDLKGVKAVFARVLGNVIKTTEPQPEKPKKKKMKKQVTWVEVDE